MLSGISVNSIFFAVKNTRNIEHYFVDAFHPSLQMIRAKAKELRMNVILGYAEKKRRFSISIRH